MTTTQPVFVIAEAGVNHNGSLEMALKLVEAAHAAGADAVKFQTFRAEDVVTPDAVTADYQRSNTGETNQFDMIRKLELDEAEHARIAAHAAALGIEFFSTPFSLEAVDLLVRLGVKRMKIPSGEITNKPLLQHAAATGLPLLMSSGMATLEEMRTAVHWIAQAREAAGLPPVAPDNLVLMHCTSAYPAPADALNLRAIRSIADAFGLPVGYSDHSQGLEAALAAVALGATVIEKHLTLDHALPGPDHLASADPQEMVAMVRAIRTVQAMLGDGVKRPQPVEANTRDVARRSVVTTRALPRGHVLAAGDLALRRPGTGIPPDQMALVVGRALAQDLPAHTTLQWAQLAGQ
ncbi:MULTISPECIES: N-acetylneuraminate synthase [Ramlibacter]|uniref:N-acetylneuraminate synthase n=1 Tax=Ramlibacter aquaticus TaxID=2780094 RepID=A0ABR9SDB5_9BURK|nr:MULTISPECIES: N-acetylneuraminate synthase [Ramlibacter]MBE7940345.1 N-acetylneuraminate synthase [Ramlibacter aquaticus]